MIQVKKKLIYLSLALY